MTDVVVETLRVRGQRADRLARVAARVLPAALERALADLDDATVDQIRVVLDLDPADHDDQTLAALWSDSIRAALLASGTVRLRPASHARAGDRGGQVEPSVRAADAVTAARVWLTRPVPRGPVPTVALALARADVADAARSLLGDGGYARLRRALATAVGPGWGASGVGEAPAPAGPDGPRAPGAGPDAVAADDGPPAGAEAPAPEVDAESPDRPVGEPPTSVRVAESSPDAAPDRLAVLAELAATADPAESGREATVDLGHVTGAAGLVLLYPWLADLCRAATALHPALDGTDIRRLTLALLADPDDPSLPHDPLVRLLAGAPPVPEEAPPDAPLPYAEEVRQDAERVLRSFAALLPGFASSSPAFVRREWIVRTGLLDTERDPAQVLVATAPLDVLLDRLPYPVALLKLPWSPALTVRFRP